MYKPPTADVLYFTPRDVSGYTQSGLWAAFSPWIPQVCGDVSVVHPDCKVIRKGDIIFFREYHPEVITTPDKVYHVIRTDNVYMIVREDKGPRSVSLSWKAA